MNRCDLARRWMDEQLDGEISAGDALELEGHLRECPSCREIASGLKAVVHGLSRLPLETMPDQDLESVLRRTVRFSHQAHPTAPRRRRIPLMYALAAAAMLAAVAIVPFAFRSTSPPEPTVAEVEAAAQDARMVLALASRAVRSAESAARDRVIVREVAPALKRVPVRWHHDPASRRNGA